MKKLFYCFMVLLLALGCAAKAELKAPEILTSDEVFVVGFAVQVAGVDYDVYVIQMDDGAQIWWVSNEARIRVDYNKGSLQWCTYPFQSARTRALEYELQELIGQLFLKRAEIEF